MQDSGVRGAAKDAVGTALGGAAGVVCMRTRCQDVVPRALSGECKDAGKGREARRECKPLLESCQEDAVEIARCAERCSRYYDGGEAQTCERDCNLARCRVYPPYDACVQAQTLRNVLACFERTACRADAENCLRMRCDIEPSGDALVKDL